MNIQKLFYRLKWALTAPYVEEPIAWAVVRNGVTWCVYRNEPSPLSVPSDGHIIPLIAHPDFHPTRGSNG